ncbi:hypothetical protein PP899_gp33 [Agrobacterium phage Atu_ph08]|uniref:Uncharacterized protein n=1 Tax=Agrobacterium phage Atu_ph08 TaxID=2024265 RepID=A0A223W0X8_9CAUD|nr:hypothetical protein PP899_gp33 [Agrobacterium phage Atu_ph08]ASV44788.1 hypothetical protein [Agrobacterium phage Atu_ph08]
MPKASEVMTRASVLLLDEDNVRWPLSELADCINDAVKAIVLAKPSASAKTAQFFLEQGTYQKIPETLDNVTPLQLLGVNRNIIDTVKNLGGRAIRTAARAMLDSHEPNWHNPAYVPFAKEVRQVIFDENVPLEFSCYPGNDGHGVVEIAISYLPPKVAPTPNKDVEKLEAWDVEIGIPEPYTVPLIDYVLFKAFSKDDIAGDPAKAMTHYQTFATALGIKVQGEAASNPNRRR